VLGFALVVFGFSMVMLTLGIYDTLSAYELQDIIISFAFGATCVVVFIFGVFYVVSTMYHATDIEMLRSLPLKPYQILGGKFITLIVFEYIMEAYILLPVLIGFGIKSGGGVPYIVYSVILLIITPVIGLSIAGVLVMIIMRFTSFGKNKQVFNFVGSILIIGLAIGLNIVMQKLGNISEAQLAAIMAGDTTMATVVSKMFPGVIFAANSIVYSQTLAGLGNLALFILCCAAGAALFLGVGQLVYFQGVTGITESAAKRKGVSDIAGKTKRTSNTIAYLKKEMRLLFRSPIGFMNCVLINLIWPVIIMVMLLSGGQVGELRSLAGTINQSVAVAIFVAISSFISATNATASTAISREGRELYVSKYIPMEFDKQLSAKLINAFVLSAIGITLMFVLSLILGYSLSSAVIALLLSFVAAAVLAAAGLLIDVAHPKLDWMNEQQAIKQNINVMLHMIVGVVLAAVMIIPVIFAQMPLFVAVVYMGAVLAVLLMLLLRWMRKGASKKLAEMDV
jgi:ABC-2 type transport system permease protein